MTDLVCVTGGVACCVCVGFIAEMSGSSAGGSGTGNASLDALLASRNAAAASLDVFHSPETSQLNTPLLMSQASTPGGGSVGGPGAAGVAGVAGSFPSPLVTRPVRKHSITSSGEQPQSPNVSSAGSSGAGGVGSAPVTSTHAVPIKHTNVSAAAASAAARDSSPSANVIGSAGAGGGGVAIRGFQPPRLALDSNSLKPSASAIATARQTGHAYTTRAAARSPFAGQSTQRQSAVGVGVGSTTLGAPLDPAMMRSDDGTRSFGAFGASPLGASSRAARTSITSQSDPAEASGQSKSAFAMKRRWNRLSHTLSRSLSFQNKKKTVSAVCAVQCVQIAPACFLV